MTEWDVNKVPAGPDFPAGAFYPEVRRGDAAFRGPRPFLATQ